MPDMLPASLEQTVEEKRDLEEKRCLIRSSTPPTLERLAFIPLSLPALLSELLPARSSRSSFFSSSPTPCQTQSTTALWLEVCVFISEGPVR